MALQQPQQVKLSHVPWFLGGMLDPNQEVDAPGRGHFCLHSIIQRDVPFTVKAASWFGWTCLLETEVCGKFHLSEVTGVVIVADPGLQYPRVLLHPVENH